MDNQPTPPDCLAAEAYQIGAGGGRVETLELQGLDATLRDLLLDMRDTPEADHVDVLEAIDALDADEQRIGALAHRFTQLVAYFAQLSDRRRSQYL
jgi:hypothetical protein